MVERRHNEELTLRLETVADVGHARVARTELQRWYGIQRVASKTRRDIVERWHDVAGDEKRELLCIERADSFLLVDGGSLKSLTKED